MSYLDDGQEFLYADSAGGVSALNGKTIESLYCFTHEGKACFCWLLIEGDTSSYRFFVEDGFICFFEKSSKEFFAKELEEYLEEKEVIDLTRRAQLSGQRIASIQAHHEVREQTIQLDIETSEGIELRLKGDFVNELDESTVLLKSKEDSEFVCLI